MTARCPPARSEIAELVDQASDAGGSGAGVAVLRALQDIHWQVHRAFCQYQSASEERRHLGGVALRTRPIVAARRVIGR